MVRSAPITSKTTETGFLSTEKFSRVFGKSQIKTNSPGKKESVAGTLFFIK